jgi:hypothetical protein
LHAEERKQFKIDRKEYAYECLENPPLEKLRGDDPPTKAFKERIVSGMFRDIAIAFNICKCHATMLEGPVYYAKKVEGVEVNTVCKFPMLIES